MEETFNIAQPIYLREQYANLDYLYGPYESVAAANAAIIPSRRAIGLTVAVIEEEGAVEYWYKTGVEDSDLEKKISEKIPKLEYTEEYPENTVLHGELGSNLVVTVKFTSQTYGQCTITVQKDGVLLKSFKANKGIIPVDLGVQNSEGSSIYTIRGEDALTIPAEEVLSFRAVVGGAKISTDFDSIVDEGINTASDITVTYSASIADTTKTVKVYGELRSSQNALVSSISLTGSGSNPYMVSGQEWNIGAIGSADTYTLKMYSYTGDNPQDISGDNVTAEVSYTFVLMEAGTFSMSSPLDTFSCDTNTAVSIPFRIYSGTRMTLQAHGELRDSGNNVVAGYALNRSVDSNVLQHWSLGKIVNEGNYTIRLWATTVGGEASPSGTVYVTIPVEVSYYQATYNIVTTGLTAEFTADGKSNNNDDDTAGYWKNSVQGSNIYFQLVDLNYRTNGWKHVDPSIEDSEPAGEMMLKFTGDSYGRLKQMTGAVPADTDVDYQPMYNLRSPNSEGFTAEIIYRTRCIGELDAKVITAHNGSGTNSCGFSASFDKLTVGSDGSQVRLDASEDEWIHATMVIDKTTHTEVDDVQDYAPRKLMTIYINGSACASSIITDNMNFTNYGPVMLNAAINNIYERVDFFGACEIKAIRFYNRPLMASEVVNNYIASIYDSERQTYIAGRNGDVLPIVRFININAEHPQYPLKEGNQLVDFATLNLMTEKARQKKEYVCARILYQENSHSSVIEWPRCTIQTQGTSTLAFPVKNYKIRLYDDADNANGSNAYKHKYYTDAFAGKGWQPEYVYTLKCDYMEAAHLNNTPSCEFYNEMIDSLIASGTMTDGWNTTHTVYTSADDRRSPSRRDGKLDAIKGFPCVVYYYESEDDYQANNGVYVGTYMFNLDKGADSLGFDAPAKLDTDGETVIPVRNPRYTVGGDEPEYRNNICQSFEGVANGSDTAGCFFSYEDWKTSYYNTYLDKAFELYSGEITNREDFVDYYLNQHPGTAYRADTGGITGMYDDHGILLEKAAYITASGTFPTEYDYFAGDFEMRYDWDDLEEGGEEYWGNSTWGLKRMIDWVSSASATAGTDNDRFRSEFGDYFNLDYCLLYYLQMIVFGQVDNAGKNSMWDTWDGLHWHPRPYDLDTMAGLNNTGIEMIDPDAELHPILSPYLNYNTTAIATGYSDNTSPIANLRYDAYNTRTSKFWIAFATSFATEIKAMYKNLRDSGVYTIEHIMQKFLSKTSDIIGEVYYNRDMATKFYKLSDITQYIDRMHGNRVQRFKAWMTNRIIFCDTLYDYISETISLNNNIFLRSDAFENNVSTPVSIGIKTYSPQYVFIDVGSGYDCKLRAYCSPDARYEDPITHETKEGTLFTIPLVAGNKEVFIYGAGNIKEIVNFGGLKANSLVLNNAKKLISLDVSYSSKLLALSLASNTYLQNLDCRGSVRLGTDASGAQLDLSNCENLKTVNLDNTKLTSVVFPQGGSLKTISMKNTAITAVNLDSLHFLTSVDVSGCENLLRYTITNCPKIETLHIDDLPLVNVSVTDCDTLRVLTLESDNSISNLYIQRCPNIEQISLKNSRSQSMGEMDFTTLYSLTSLNISGSSVHTVKLPKNESATSAVPWGSNFTTFNMAGSDIMYVQYGETPTEHHPNSTSSQWYLRNYGVDMAQLTGLTSISFTNCASVEAIFDLNYTGDCADLFNGCVALVDLEGSITCVGSGDRVFASCYTLYHLLDLTVDFSACTSLRRAFYRAAWIHYEDIKEILLSCSDSLTDITEMCREKNYNTTEQDYIDGGQSAPDMFNLYPNSFVNCNNIVYADLAFYQSGMNDYLSANKFTILGSNFDNTAFPMLKSARGMFAYTKVKGATKNFFELFPLLEDASSMFEGCTEFIGDTNSLSASLTQDFFFITDLDLTNNHPLKNISSMFYGCTNLVADMSTLGVYPFINFPDLENAKMTFMNCTNCTGVISEGLFRNNKKLVSVAGVFRATGITAIPSTGSLFRESGDTTSIWNSLTDISSMFEACTSLATTPNENLFAGCYYVQQAGKETLITPLGGSVVLHGMFYGCTSLSAFDANLFLEIHNVQNISGFFQGCTNLVGQTGGGLSASVLNTHSRLTSVEALFSGCTRLNVSLVPQLFDSSRARLTNAAGVFSGCTLISDYDPDLFTNMPKLTNVSDAFANCTSLSVQVHNVLPFAGCTSLQNVSGFYRGCTSITGSIPIELFDDCRETIANTSLMFDGCTSLDGTVRTGNEDLYTTDNPSFKLGLLAECVNLTTVSGMFRDCRVLTGAIPWDLFWTRSSSLLYSQLTNVSDLFMNAGFNTPTTVDSVDYLFHPNLFSKLIAVTTMARTFYWSRSLTSRWAAAYQAHPNAFDGQYFVANINEMFHGCIGLGGAVSNTWFFNSISTLTSAYGAFSYTKITDVGTNFLRVSANTPNTKLATASRMFYGDSYITGNLPAMNNVALYSRINYADSNAGYLGFAHGCSNAVNYSDFTEEWTRDMGYY